MLQLSWWEDFVAFGQNQAVEPSEQFSHISILYVNLSSKASGFIFAVMPILCKQVFFFNLSSIALSA